MMGLLEDFSAWLDNKKRQIVTNASDPALLYTRANEDARKFQREELENWGLLKSVMPEVKQAAQKQVWDSGMELAGLAPMGILGSIKGADKVTRAKRVVGTTGQYVGAPPGIDSPQKLAALVTHYKNTMETGLPGREFYRNSSADIWARAGHDPVLADKTASSLAYLSRSNNVGGNSTMGANAAVQAATGQPIRTGRFPSKDSAPIQEIYDSGNRGYAGHKRDPFAEQLGVQWAPERIKRGVNDMHEAEIMGYPAGKVGGPQQHAFMDEVRQRAINLANRDKLGGFDDWGTGTSQAAAWTGNKIRRGEVSPGDAAKDYAYYLPRAEANATWESFPGVGSGHLSQAPGENFAAKQWFHEQPSGQWQTSPAGRDVGYTASGLLPGADVAAVGRFGNEVNPAVVARPLTATAQTPTGPVIPQYSQDALNLVEGARAYFDVQNAGAWHKVMPSKAPAYSAAGVKVPGLDEQKMKALAPRFEALGLDVASAPGGFTVMAIGEKAPRGEAFAKAVRAELKAAGINPSGAEFGRLESGYIDYSKAWPQGKGSDAATKGLLDLVEKSPTVAKALEDSDAYRFAAAARTERDLAAQNAGWGAPREDVLRAREIFKKHGWQGLRDAIGKGLLPSAVISTLFGGGLLASGEQPQ